MCVLTALEILGGPLVGIPTTGPSPVQPFIGTPTWSKQVKKSARIGTEIGLKNSWVGLRFTRWAKPRARCDVGPAEVKR